MPSIWGHRLFLFFLKGICVFGSIIMQMSQNLNAQNNLVPNPSFEILSDCPNSVYGIDLAQNWFSATTNGSPDIYNQCAINSNFGVPKNAPDSYQMAFHGAGYAGLYNYFSGIQFYREYIEVELIENLAQAKPYFYRFRFSPRVSANPNDFPCYTNGLACVFTKERLIENLDQGKALDLTPENQPLPFLITDTLEWQTVSGCKRGDAEKFFIIGNFADDQHTMVSTSCGNSFPNGSYMFVDMVEVYAFDPLPDTLLLCENDSLILQCNFLNGLSEWSTGVHGNEITVDKPGLYVVRVNIDGCQMEDSVWVFSPADLFPAIPFSEELCIGDSLTLKPPVFQSVLWENGDTNWSKIVDEAGLYEANVTTTCGEFLWQIAISEKDCKCVFYIPNAFTPNGDGLNDSFLPVCSCDYQLVSLSLEVFDSWGKLFWKSEGAGNVIEEWKGTNALSGTYKYLLRFSYLQNGSIQTGQYAGSINIIR